MNKEITKRVNLLLDPQVFLLNIYCLRSTVWLFEWWVQSKRSSERAEERPLSN